jgi:outer membrane protein
MDIPCYNEKVNLMPIGREKGFFMIKFEKKQVKIVSLTIALFFMLGVVGLALSQSGKSYAAGSSNNSNIGVVNHQMLVSQLPEMAKAQEDMQAAIEAAKKEFDAKTASMNEQDKQAYYGKVQQELSLKQQQLVSPVFEKVDAAIKAVADAKGLSVVMDKANVVYGGQDITDEVTKKLSGK